MMVFMKINETNKNKKLTSSYKLKGLATLIKWTKKFAYVQWQSIILKTMKTTASRDCMFCVSMLFNSLIQIKIKKESRLYCIDIISYQSSAQDPDLDLDPLDPQEFVFLDPDPDLQKYADPQIRIQSVKYQPKTAKKTFFTPKIKIRTFEKKRDYKNFLIPEWFIKDKNMRKKIKQKI